MHKARTKWDKFLTRFSNNSPAGLDSFIAKESRDKASVSSLVALTKASAKITDSFRIVLEGLGFRSFRFISLTRICLASLRSLASRYDVWASFIDTWTFLKLALQIFTWWVTKNFASVSKFPIFLDKTLILLIYIDNIRISYPKFRFRERCSKKFKYYSITIASKSLNASITETPSLKNDIEIDWNFNILISTDDIIQKRPNFRKVFEILTLKPPVFHYLREFLFRKWVVLQKRFYNFWPFFEQLWPFVFDLHRHPL